jgi:PKD repeat protein
MKQICILLLMTLCSSSLFAQLSQGGSPFSFQQPQLLQNTVPFETMPQIDLERLIAEDLINDQYKDVPWRFGENIMVNFNPANSGVWDILPKGDKVWRLGISSPGAYTINLTFDKYKLPPGAKLFVFNMDFSETIGAFTDFNNQDDGYFATTLVQGDAIIIEYYEPSTPLFTGELNLEMVTHGYRDVFKYAKAFGQSGSCNVNVACPQSAGMENQIRSVCMIITGGYLCSAALINNTAQDGKPYILSANHCYSNPGSVVFWFNWQSPTCANPSSSPPYNSMSGATQRASYSSSDVWLMELNQSIPSSFNVYYSGWNRTMDNYITGKIWGIHHPSGDIKKISWSYLGVSTTTYGQNSVPGNGTHWRITNWSDGTTTEGGSSGSPVYDPAGRIIGQLHGGSASCSSITSDWYGKFGVSWTGGGTNATRLSNWLDPINSGVITLEGYDPNVISAPPVANFSASTTNPGVGQTVQFTDMSSNAPTSWSWSFSPSTITYAGGTNSSSKNPQVQFNAEGYYTVSLTATNAYGSGNETKTNYIQAINCTFNTLPFTEAFPGSTIPTCWQIIDNQGNGQVWQFGAFSGGVSGTGGNYAFLNSDGYGSGSSQNSDLVTPTLDFSGYTNVTLSFQHYFRQYSSSSGTLSYSINNGTSWTTVQTWTTTTANPAAFNQVIAAVGGQSQVKFRWKYVGSWDWYWSVDNVSITGTPAGSPPVAQFTTNNTTPNVGETVNFTDQSTNSPTSWSWSFTPGTITYAGGTNNASQNPQVQFNAGGSYSVTLVASNASGSGSETKTDFIQVINPIIELNLNVYLEGPFNGNQMNAILDNHIPLIQPYNVSPWNYAGSESVVSIPANVVDWVLVELRDAPTAGGATSSTVFARKAGFILYNGQVVGLDGISNLTFPNSVTQQLFVVIWHRNHLGIMSASAVTSSGGIHSYDFTTGSATAHGGVNGHKQLATGVWGMISGDGDRDGVIGMDDKSGLWESEAGTEGYMFSDYNLDRQSNNIDKDSFWVPNIGRGSQVPD